MAGRIFVTHIVQAAEACTGVTLTQLRDESKKAPLVRIRHACIILAHRHTLLSVSAIGRYFHRDHTTALYVLNTWPYDVHEVTAMYVELIDGTLRKWESDGYLTASLECRRRFPVLPPPAISEGCAA